MTVQDLLLVGGSAHGALRRLADESQRLIDETGGGERLSALEILSGSSHSTQTLLRIDSNPPTRTDADRTIVKNVSQKKDEVKTRVIIPLRGTYSQMVFFHFWQSNVTMGLEIHQDLSYSGPQQLFAKE